MELPELACSPLGHALLGNDYPGEWLRHDASILAYEYLVSVQMLDRSLEAEKSLFQANVEV